MINGLVLIGAPGAGKGTLGQRWAQNSCYEHFSSGDLLRDEVRKKSQVGNEIKELITKGSQVSDQLVCQLVFTKITELVQQNQHFVLDGFPQTITQLQRLNTFSDCFYGQLRMCFVCVEVSLDTALHRMTERISCAVCNTIFSRPQLSPQQSFCLRCNGQLYQRASDSKQQAKTRLKTFEKTTQNVLSHLKKDPNTILIDGNKTKDLVFKEFQQKIT